MFHIWVLQAAQMLVTRELGAFVEVEVGGDVVAKTNTKSNSRREPTWNEAFSLDLCHDIKYIKLRVCCSRVTCTAACHSEEPLHSTDERSVQLCQLSQTNSPLYVREAYTGILRTV